MNNLAMQEKLASGECLDLNVIGEEQPDGTYEIRPGEFKEDVDYCDAEDERWVWSIGRRLSDGRVFASFDTRFYGTEEYKCLWLR